MGKTLQFNKDQNLSIEGAEYRVTGGIEFHNRSDGSRWWEYCLLETRTRGIKWLSIDNIYEEYAIYTQCPYGSEFDEMNIFRDGYRQADAGQAVVTSGGYIAGRHGPLYGVRGRYRRAHHCGGAMGG